MRSEQKLYKIRLRELGQDSDTQEGSAKGNDCIMVNFISQTTDEYPDICCK